MKLRELINNLEEISNNGKNDEMEVITRDIETCILSETVSVRYVTHDNCILISIG